MTFKVKLIFAEIAPITVSVEANDPDHAAQLAWNNNYFTIKPRSCIIKMD